VYEELTEHNIEEFMDTIEKDALYNFMLENMGDILRIVNTGIIIPEDQEMLHKSLVICTGIFFNKSANNEFEDVGRMH